MNYHKITYRKEPQNGFYATLRSRVEQYMKSAAQKKFNIAHAKVIAFGGSYFGAYGYLLFMASSPQQILVAYLALGICNFLIFLNVVHESMHGALFAGKKLNAMAGHWLEWSGTSSYFWRKRHLQMHHPYPNIVGWDLDIEQSGLIRLSQQEPYRKYHRLQQFYLPVMYLFFSLNWFISRDTKDYRRWKSVIPKWVLPLMILCKFNHLFFMIALPAIVSPTMWISVLSGFLIMHFTMSGLAVMALLTAHVGEDAEFPRPDENGHMTDTWAIHQVRTTHDFATDNKMVNFLFGGFNFHVAHHLFPSTSHIHYAAITSIIQKTADEFGVEYKCEKLGEALVSHFHLLHKTSFESMEI
ncbi:MAG: acyl-CoA desaturase [Chitinophagaceae bacterium]|nr:acyl-CoA desaturase [Chitinophagaceae bacterium]